MKSSVFTMAFCDLAHVPHQPNLIFLIFFPIPEICAPKKITSSCVILVHLFLPMFVPPFLSGLLLPDFPTFPLVLHLLSKFCLRYHLCVELAPSSHMISLRRCIFLGQHHRILITLECACLPMYDCEPLQGKDYMLFILSTTHNT